METVSELLCRKGFTDNADFKKQYGLQLKCRVSYRQNEIIIQMMKRKFWFWEVRRGIVCPYVPKELLEVLPKSIANIIITYVNPIKQNIHKHMKAIDGIQNMRWPAFFHPISLPVPGLKMCQNITVIERKDFENVIDILEEEISKILPGTYISPRMINPVRIVTIYEREIHIIKKRLREFGIQKDINTRKKVKYADISHQGSWITS